MRSEFVLLLIIGGFLSALLVFVIIIYKPNLPVFSYQTVPRKEVAAISSPDLTIELRSKIRWLEENINNQQKELDENNKNIASLEAEFERPTPTPSIPVGKSILAVANTQGSLFTTSATTYTPMGMYVNINCSKKCLLWINFFTSSKNTGNAVSAQGNQNTYDIFLDDVDKSIFTQASYPIPSTSVPVSLNAAIPVGAGFHTVDIRTKTTGGTLQSDSSTLQVMAIER